MGDGPRRLVTDRLEIRHPTERDRGRLVELFTDDDFMVFSDATLSEVEANLRFDRMRAVCAELSFAKQPIVERATGEIIGYTGVDWIDFEDRRWLEWGYRLAPAARGRGYATEASIALLAAAAEEYAGEILGIIHPDNDASHAVIRKLGFEHWKRAPVFGELRDLYRLEL